MLLIKSLEDNESVTSFSLLRSKQVRKKKNGDPYLRLVLTDRSGSIEARVWEGAKEYDELLKEGNIVEYQGRVESYNGTRQLIISKIRVIELPSVPTLTLSDFVRSTQHDVRVMWARLREIVETETKRKCVRLLLERILDRYENEIKTFPAGVEVHHNYVGGFLEHVVSICETVLHYSNRFPDLDRDLLVAGAIVHDIGKFEELSGPVAPQYTLAGNLIGHVVLGRDLLRQAVSIDPQFPPRLLMLLEHMVLSHQGQLEWGAPKQPMLPEALVLHYVDDLDAKLNRSLNLVETSTTEGEFTARDFHLGRPLFQGSYDEHQRVSDSPAGEDPQPLLFG